MRTELRWPTLGEADLAGRLVTEVVAYGKQILTRFAPADPAKPQPRIPTVPDVALTLRSHLRMEGSWYVHARDAEPWPTRNRASVRAVLGGTEWTAVGNWLGLLDLIPTSTEQHLIGHLGPDIMADGFEPDGAAEAGRRLLTDPARHVGAALLDQTTVAGIGTMYMAETLFMQKVSPWTPIGDVDVPAVLSTARRLLLRGASQAKPTDNRQPAKGHGELGARPLRPAVPALRNDRPGGDDRPAAQGADRVLLPAVPAGADAHRRRQGAEPVGHQPGSRRQSARHGLSTLTGAGDSDGSGQHDRRGGTVTLPVFSSHY